MLNKYIVERDQIVDRPDVAEDAAEIIARVRVLSRVGTGIVWVESFRAAGKEYSVYLATDEAFVHAYARGRGGAAYRLFPVLAPARGSARAA